MKILLPSILMILLPATSLTDTPILAPQCHNIFAANSEGSFALRYRGIDYTGLPKIDKILKNIELKNGLSPLQIKQLVVILLREEKLSQHKELGFISGKKDEWKDFISSERRMNKHLEHEIARHSLVDSFKRFGVYRHPTLTENFRSFLNQSQAVPVAMDVMRYIAISSVAGPTSLLSILSLPVTSYSFLRSKPIPETILKRALTEGVDAVLPELRQLYSKRSQVEVAQDILSKVISVTFFLLTASFLVDQQDWIVFAIKSLLHPVDAEYIEQIQSQLGLEQRVHIQVSNWKAAFLFLNGRAASTTEVQIKTNEIRIILTQQRN